MELIPHVVIGIITISFTGNVILIMKKEPHEVFIKGFLLRYEDSKKEIFRASFTNGVL